MTMDEEVARFSEAIKVIGAHHVSLVLGDDGGEGMQVALVSTVDVRRIPKLLRYFADQLDAKIAADEL